MPDAGMLDAGAGCRMPGMSKTPPRYSNLVLITLNYSDFSILIFFNINIPIG